MKGFTYACWAIFDKSKNEISKKYRLDKKDSITHNGHTLYRIVALRTFRGVSRGEKGGYVESEKNLDHDGNSWIFNDAKAYGDAIVCNHARLFNNSEAFDNAFLGGHAILRENAKVCGNASVVHTVSLTDNVIVRGGVELNGDFEVCGDAVIEKGKDYFALRDVSSPYTTIVWTRSNNMWKADSFYGNSEELVKEASKCDKMKGLVYKACVELVEKLREIDETPINNL